MSAPQHVLRDFIRWCDRCRAMVEVEKLFMPDLPVEVRCRSCQAVLAEGGSDG